MRYNKRQENIPNAKTIIRSRFSMTQKLGLSEMKSKRIMITVLKTLMEKVDNMQEQMDNFRKEMLTVIKNQMEMLNKKRVKNHHVQQ